MRCIYYIITESYLCLQNCLFVESLHFIILRSHRVGMFCNEHIDKCHINNNAVTDIYIQFPLKMADVVRVISVDLYRDFHRGFLISGWCWRKTTYSKVSKPLIILTFFKKSHSDIGTTKKLGISTYSELFLLP